jgi:hypothetical protein
MGAALADGEGVGSEVRVVVVDGVGWAVGRVRSPSVGYFDGCGTLHWIFGLMLM